LPYSTTSLSALYSAHSTPAALIGVQPLVPTSDSPNLPPIQALVNPPFHPPLSVPINLRPNNATENRQQETLQALLALATSLNPLSGKKELGEEKLEKKTLEQLIGYSEIDENETHNCLPVPSPPDTLISDSPIDVSYSNSPLLPLSPKNKDNNILSVNMLASHTSEKNKPSKVAYCYNKAENAYIKEETVKPDPCESITNASATESSVSDLFYYYYEDSQDLYQIRRLESRQHFWLQQFLDNNLDLLPERKSH
ncbi:6966_t:CDS:2, partial [Racocetra fulgida]